MSLSCLLRGPAGPGPERAVEGSNVVVGQQESDLGTRQVTLAEVVQCESLPLLIQGGLERRSFCVQAALEGANK